MALTGTIFIENMRLHALHGVLDQERVVGNDYSITLRVDYPTIEAACESDDLADTISYASLAEIIKEEMAIPSALVENVAGRIVKKVRAAYPTVKHISIIIKKIAPPMQADCNGAGVELHWDD